MKKTIILFLTLLLSSLFFVNNTSAFNTGTLVTSNFGNSSTYTICNDVTDKCYYVKNNTLYTYNGISLFSFGTVFAMIVYNDRIIVVSGDTYILNTNTNVVSTYTTDMSDSVGMYIAYSNAGDLFVYGPSGSYVVGSQINLNTFNVTNHFVNTSLSNFNITRNIIGTPVDIKLSSPRIFYIINNKLYFYISNSFSTIDLFTSIKTDLIPSISQTVSKFNVIKKDSTTFYLSFEVSNPGISNAFLHSYYYNGIFNFLGNKYYQFLDNTKNSLTYLENIDYYNQVYTGSTAPVFIPFLNTLTQSFDMTYIAKDLGLYNIASYSSGQSLGGGSSGSSGTMSGTITSTGSISLKREQQNCTARTFSVSTPTTSESYIDTSNYTYCGGVNTPCTDDGLSDVYDSSNSIVFRSNQNSVGTFNLFNSGSSFTGVELNSFNPFVGIGYMANSTVGTQLLKVKTTNYILGDTTIKIELTDDNGTKGITEIQANKNSTYNVYFPDKREISLYKITVTTDKSTLTPILKNISYYKYTSGSSSQNKTRYKCTSQYLSCDWTDYDTPEKQSYCYVSGDYNYIKDDYLVQNYEDNTQKNISLDTSGIDSGLNNINDSIKDIKNSFGSGSQNISDSNTGQLNNILNQNNIGSGGLSSLQSSQLYQSFSGIISLTTSILSTNYNTGVTFSGSACGKGNSGYPITLSLPTGNNLSFQNHTVYLPNKKYTPCHTANIGGGTINTEYNNIFKYLLLVFFISIYFSVLYLFYRYIIFGFFIFIFELLKKFTSTISFGFIDSNSPETGGATDYITQIIVFFIITAFFVSFIVFFNYFTGGILTSLLNLLVTLKDIFGNLLNFIYTTLINQDTTAFYITILYINSSIILLLVGIFNYFIAKKFGGAVAILAIIISLIARFSDFFINLFKDLFSFF